jgi:hypothetical protein
MHEATVNLLETHDDKWEESSEADYRYSLELPDGTTEQVQTTEDVWALLFKNYRYGRFCIPFPSRAANPQLPLRAFRPIRTRSEHRGPRSPALRDTCNKGYVARTFYKFQSSASVDRNENPFRMRR